MSLLSNTSNRFNTFMSGLSPEANLGLLTGGLSLLSGEPIGKAINTGMGMYSNLQGFGDKNKQRSAIKELEEKYKNDPKMLALLKANPTGFIQALTTSTLTPKTPVANYKTLTDQEKIDLGIKPYLFAQRNLATNKVEIKNPFENVDKDTLQSLSAQSGNLSTETPVSTNQTMEKLREESETGGDLGTVDVTPKAEIINVDVDKGTALVKDDNPLGAKVVPLPGSELDLALIEQNKANKNYYNNLNKRVGTLNREIDKALKILEPNEGVLGSVGFGTGAGIESLISGLPASQARELNATLDTIKGIVGFERLGEMRQESKTGGALGAINTAELNLLTTSQGSLDQGLSPDTLRKNLRQLQANYAETLINADRAYEEQFGAIPERFDEDDLPNFTSEFKRLMGPGLTDEQLQLTWEALTPDLRNAFK